MSPLNALIFGLGLFFLGLRLIGDNLRRLTGPGFRQILKRTTHSPRLGGVIGVFSGALMQSATAVTFILVSMTGTGLIKPRAAAPIVIWSNVGLTALAFVATLNIHPMVAFVVGGAGIVLGTVRIPIWQTVAGTLLGMGLILVGLGQMSDGAAPLKDAEWFRQAITAATANPALTFLTGIAVAAILQSNTGAAMLVITFAASGLLSLHPAMLLIYGTNLGAIALRLFLGAGLHGAQFRLVRLEDLFCIVSGAMMVTLFAMEVAGVPLVAALAGTVAHGLTAQLAVVFLLSNLLPALLVSAVLGRCMGLLEAIWPDRAAADDPSQPMFLRKQALDDPPTALDLLSRELARLLSTVRVVPVPNLPDDQDAPPPAFRALALAIEDFAAKLAARGTLNTDLSARLHMLRAELSLIRHIEEGVRHFCRALGSRDFPAPLAAKMEHLLLLGAQAAGTMQSESIQALHEQTRQKNPDLKQLEAASTSTLAGTAIFEDFCIAAWTLHRLAKLLDRLRE